MTAKEWLIEEGFIDPTLGIETDTGFEYSLHVVMERFANNRSSLLQAKILTFRKKLLTTQLNAYDEHFGIKHSIEGEVS